MRMKIRKKKHLHTTLMPKCCSEQEIHTYYKVKKEKNARAQIILFAEYIHSSLF